MAVKSRKDEYFDELEIMSPLARRQYIDAKLAETVAHAYERAPAVKNLFEKAGIGPAAVRTVQDLENLPVTRKTDLLEMQKAALPYGGVLAMRPENVERIFISPGPIYEIQPSGVRWFAKSFWAAGFRKGDVVINTFTYHMSPAGILFHEAIRDCRATVVVAGTGNTDLQIQIMKDLKVTGFVGTPSFLNTIIKRAEELGNDIKRDFSIKRAWFTGEMLPPSLRKTFEENYNIDTYQAYAVTEPGGAIAYECRHKSGMHLMDEYVTEIVDPETGKQLGPGEVGEIVTTQLMNKNWGLLRFGTGDLSSFITEPCPCGRTAYRLTGIVGRAGDAVKVRGMFIVARQAEQAIMGFSQIARYQLVVGRREHRDEMILKIELKDAVVDKSRLSLDINNKFQDICRIKIDKIDFVEPGSIGEKGQGIKDERKWE
ncbi:MAG: AMP-binding protein [Chloroflexi bacterium RBG_13_57_8]|nr:MAG: AMP-binding protein [Chloroflexi bacterium RBG_13_57_8]